jgi:diheme cytochrome c
MTRARIILAALLLPLVAVQPPSRADADGRLAVPANGVWKTECGACHLPYPPSLLPARSWQAIMGRLDQHFGADASLDPKTVAELTSFLERYAGPDRGVTPTNRITDTAWFRRKHREVPVAVWKHADVKSTANCAACHRGAERGDYDEHGVRLPR